MVSNEDSITLREDDLQIGDYITILKWNPVSYQEIDGNGNVIIITNKEENNVGTMFKILTIDRPFIGVMLLSEKIKVVLDTRQCKLKKFSKEFVNIMLEGEKL